MLLGQQLQNLLALCGARPFVRKRPVKGDILTGEKPVQANDVHVKAIFVPVQHFPFCHPLRSQFREIAPAKFSTGPRRPTCVNAP
ncbi:MAG TPA: hypothetical protein VE970_06080 [Pseudolabrys sp.]|nr:hypothetical protein [Pseudolabrys sp.]